MLKQIQLKYLLWQYVHMYIIPIKYIKLKKKKKRIKEMSFILISHFHFLFQVQTTTMCISVSLSGSVVLGCLFAPKVHIILFQPQKNVSTLRVATTRFSVTTGPGSSFSQGISRQT